MNVSDSLGNRYQLLSINILILYKLVKLNLPICRLFAVIAANRSIKHGILVADVL